MCLTAKNAKIIKNTLTSLLRGDHQRLGRLPPSLAGLSGESEHVDRLGLQRRRRVLSRARAQHVHGGAVAVGRVLPVRDLISCGANAQKGKIAHQFVCRGAEQRIDLTAKTQLNSSPCGVVGPCLAVMCY